VTPRTYSQDRRAESAAATRQRILDAALEHYKEVGIAATTITAVAARADVARGTVLNHFGNADGLLNAVLDRVVTWLEYVDERIQEGAVDERERIYRYVDAMFRFFVRSASIWPAVSRDLDHPILRERESQYYAVIARLHAATFGDLAGDRVIGAATRAFVNYAPYYDLRGAGLSLEEAVDIVARSLITLAEGQRTRQEGGTA
jgi:AcrR family transcriptional regulator